MKDYLMLLKLLLKLQFKKDPKAKSRRVAMIVYAALGAYAAVVLSALLFFFGGTISDYGFVAETVSALMIMGFLFVLIFGTINILSYMYFSPDNDFLMSLPIKPNTVFAAKLSVVYVLNAAYSLVFILPIMFLGISAGLNPFIYPMILLAVILVPVIPLLFASLLAMPLMFITSRLKHRGLATSLLVIALICVFLVLYMSFVSSMGTTVSSDFDIDAIMSMLKDALTAISNFVYPLYSFGRFMTLTPVQGFDLGASMAIDAVIFFGTVMLSAALVVVASGGLYRKVVLRQSENSLKSVVSNKDFESSSVLKTLVKKEWREMSRNSAFAIQCLAGAVIAPIMVGIMSFSLYNIITSNETAPTDIIDMNMFSAMIWALSTFFIQFMGVGVNVFSMTAMTREGKSYEVSKMIPVDYKTQMKAKMILGMILSYIPAGLSLVVVEIVQIIMGNYNPIFFILIAGMLLIYNYGYNCYLINRDLKNPKLDWVTPSEAVKNNKSMLIPMLLDIGISVVFALVVGLTFTLMQMNTVAMIVGIVANVLVLIGGSLAFALPAHFAINRNVEKYYGRIGDN